MMITLIQTVNTYLILPENFTLERKFVEKI